MDITVLLNGKTIIVTGASNEIDTSPAKLCAAEGADIVLCARRSDLSEQVASEIHDKGDSAVCGAEYAEDGP